MGPIWRNKKFGTWIWFLMITVCLLLPSQIWSAGYQEEKLFDSNVYSRDDLIKKIEMHQKEIKVLDKQIKMLEQDIDWMVLKINQIEDSGRTAPMTLKESISKKEKRIASLMKTRNRLEYVVRYYSELMDTKKKRDLEDIYRKMVPSIKAQKKAMAHEAQPRMMSESISEERTARSASAPVSSKKISGQFNGMSKEQLEAAIEKSGLGDWVEIVGDGTCLRLETTLPILFPTGSAKVADEYKTFFKKLADFLKPYDVRVLVNGYADKVPIKNKKYPSNFELGATRAANIVHQMVGYGLKPSIFRVESTGKYRFEAKGMSKQKTLERRAEVTVIFSG